jgi:hypothetical protein
MHALSDNYDSRQTFPDVIFYFAINPKDCSA